MTYDEYIESPLFTKLIPSYLDDEYATFQWELALHPEAGSVIPNSGGLRKIRWHTRGKGKRGGLRIIYYYIGAKDQIWLLTLCAKSEASTIPGPILQKIKEAFMI